MTDTLALAIKLDADAAALKKELVGAGVDVRKFTGESVAGMKKMRDGTTQLSRDRALLGVRSERAIQQEIRATEAAYERLRRNGSVSLREQARAAEATKKKVAELRAEMRGVQGSKEHGPLAASVGRMVVAAAAAGAVYKASDLVKRTADYDLKIAYMANTAYSDQSPAERIAGKQQLKDGVMTAIRHGGGGTRETVADTLSSLLASGVFKSDQILGANGLLTSVNRGAVASGANPEDIAAMATAAVKSMGVDPSRVDAVIGKGITAGQLGAFELSDMARQLPAQMAFANMVGLRGEAGLEKLLVANQASMLTAGGADQAGNNLTNLLGKISSPDAAGNVKKLLGANLAKRLVSDREKGLDSLDSFAGVARDVMAKNKDYRRLQAELKGAKDDGERRAIMESQSAILQGSAIGKLIQDKEAIQALVGYLAYQDSGKMQEVSGKVRAGGGEVDRSLQVVTDTNANKFQRLDAEMTFFGEKITGSLDRGLGNIAATFASTMGDYWKKEAAREQRLQAREQERAKVDGTIKIQIDSDGKPRARSVSSNGVDINVDTGYSVGAD